MSGLTADVAQWKSTAFVKLRLRVRLPPSAVPLESMRACPGRSIMETEVVSDIQRQTSSGKLAVAAVISILLGLGLIALLLLVHLFGLDSGSDVSELVQFLLFVGGVLLFIIAPFLGIFAVADVVIKRGDFKNPDGGPYDRGQILKTARSFLAASLLYALFALPRVVAGIISPAVGTILSTTVLSIWFISIALLALLTGGISFMLFARASGSDKARIGAGFAVLAGLAAVGAIPWSTNFGAFGAWGFESCYKRMREQVEILYVQEDHEATDRDLQMKEFAVDLCRHSKPYQVVVAVVEPRASLARTLEYLRGRIADSRRQEDYGRTSLLDDVDVLMVPEMFWEIDHRFDELIGKVVANANPAMPIIEARQAIKFKLDRCGAMLESEAMIAVAAIPKHFIFNRPFLVHIKKRDSEQPFFVMWVDNAELLNRK